MSTASGFSQDGRPAKCFNVHLLSYRLLYCCFVDILVPRSLRRTPFRVCFNRYSAIILPAHDELVLIAATNQPAVQAVEEAVGTPAVPGKLRLHCRQLLRGSASHPTCGMLSTKNWAVSLGYATLSTSPRRTGKTRSHPPTRYGCVATARDASAIPCCGARGVRSARWVGTFRRYHHWLVTPNWVLWLRIV